MYWKVYYSDGSTVNNTEFSPENIPHRTDVQVIVQESADHKWNAICSDDYYIWTKQDSRYEWVAVDKFGLYDYFLKTGWKCILCGVTIGNEQFRKIFSRAKAEFGNKEAFASEERHP